MHEAETWLLWAASINFIIDYKAGNTDEYRRIGQSNRDA